MTWEHFNIEQSGKCKIIHDESGNLIDCEYARGIITTGKSREFWGYQILIKVGNEEMAGRDHANSETYAIALEDLNSKLESKGLSLLVAGNANSYSESPMSGGSGYGYTEGQQEAVDIMSFFRRQQ